MTGLVFIWRGNKLERTVNGHAGPIFSMFSSDNCVVTGAKEKYEFEGILNCDEFICLDVHWVQHEY